MKQRAFAVLEYLLLVMVLVVALIAFRAYIQRGMQGQYKRAGETFGYGRQYGPTSTIECAYDDKAGVWYSVACFNNQVLRARCKNSSQYFQCAEAVMQQCTRGCSE